jgi:hypothetical protein
MSIHQYRRILLVNGLLIVFFNGLFAWPSVKALAAQPQLAVLIGMAFYLVQLLTTRWLLGDQKAWLIQPISGKRIGQALGAMIVVELLATALIVTLTAPAPAATLTNHWPGFLAVFMLNSLPGALSEEWLFRYLPLRFSRPSKRNYQTIISCIGALVLFTLVHTPAYLLQYDRPLSDLCHVFVMGLFFLLVYLLTRNLVFTALFHGLTNNPLFLVESAYSWLYFYISIVLVSSGWALRNWQNRRRSAVG